MEARPARNHEIRKQLIDRNTKINVAKYRGPDNWWYYQGTRYYDYGNNRGRYSVYVTTYKPRR